MNNNIYELEGDLQALKLVDLDREGLAEYQSGILKSQTAEAAIMDLRSYLNGSEAV